MRLPTSKPLLARTPPDRFIGREGELERLYLRAIASGGRAALSVVAPAGAGLSELLRQVYDRAFAEQRFVVPFYFSVRAEDVTAHAAAARYQYQFLLQAIAFRRQQASLIRSSPDICELSKLAPINDAEWVSQMCEVCRNDGPLNDERAFIRTALNAPYRAAAAANLQVVVIVDNLHELTRLKDGHIYRSELFTIAERSNVPLLLASRKSSPEVQALERMEIGPFGRSEMARLAGVLASEADVATNEQTLDLIAAKFGGKPRLLELFVQAARSKGIGLESYKDVERLYSDELLDGRLGAHFEQMFANAIADMQIRQKLYNELYLTEGSSDGPFSLSALQERLAAGSEEVSGIIESLLADEVLRLDNGNIRLSSDVVLRDFLASRHRSSASRRTPATVAAFTVTNALKRAPTMMSRIYRREAALFLADILLLLDVQNVPLSLIDFRAFRDEFKGLSDDQIRARQAASGGENIALPQIVHAAQINDHFPEFNFAEPERAVVGVGFRDQRYRDEDEVAWFAAEIDSKLEADASLTRDWCARMDLAARELGYANYHIWLVSPEGFTDTALEILAEHNGFGSSRRQVELLRQYLLGNEAEANQKTAEYEIVIPAGGETELIAAHALEEIARRYELPAKTVNQIKTALVEACINVAEHSFSPDNRIHQKFEVGAEKITITVSNRGLRLTDRQAEQTAEESAEGRRGWGLGLIRSLMDEVQILPVDDGTRIVMTKYIQPANKS